MVGFGATVVVALLVRLMVIALQSGAPIDMDGAEYARHAQNLSLGLGDAGMRGDVDLGPPLYPLMIAALLPAIGDAQLAGNLVAAIAGAALTAAVWALGALTYDRTIATIAAAIVAIVPASVAPGSNVLSETPFAVLIIVGLWLLLRTLRNHRSNDAAACGAAFGLAYLARWQGFVFPLFAFLALALPTIRSRRVPRAAFIAVAVAFLIVLPYLVYGYRTSGRLWIEGESNINASMADGMMRGLSYLAVADAVDSDGRPRGVEVDPRAWEIAPGPPLLTRVEVAAYAAVHHVHDLGRAFVGRDFGYGLLVALSLIGLVASPWSSQRRRDEAVLLAAVALLYLELSSVWHFWPRYAAVFVPFLALWAAKGSVDLASWSRSSRLPNIAIPALACFAAIALVADWQLATAKREAPERAAGAWIAAQSADPPIVDVSDQVTYYAGVHARWSPMPYAAPAAACRYLARMHAGFVVIDTSRAADYPPLASWFADGPSCANITLSYTAGRLRVYRYGPTPTLQSAKR